ncbi:MAG: aspartate aminotransferase family protein, partial [Bacteroidales bacterium]|nr:aspartate aminotransferase family protein [Bacteroidales bacterium]
MNLFDVYPLYDVTPVKGKGCYIWDEKGNKYLDLYGGHAVISIGHSHPTYIKSIEEQLHNIGFYSNFIINPLQVKLANKLGKASGCDNYNLFLCNSGAEAIENALKIASFHNKKRKVVAFSKAFHGRTSCAVAITDNPKISAEINKNLHVIFCPLNNYNEFNRIMQETEGICAVIIEGIQGIGGINIPEANFLKEIESRCKMYDIVFILDEIQSGYGRSGKFFSFQYANIEPDIITVAKGMGNGFPVGGVLIHEKYKAEHGMLGTTFGGNYLACAASLAVLEVLEQEKLIENAEHVGNFFISELKKLPFIKDVRGLGLMIGLEFDFSIIELRKKLIFENQIFTGVTGDKIIRLLPPL